jgi:hypothetical protein
MHLRPFVVPKIFPEFHPGPPLNKGSRRDEEVKAKAETWEKREGKEGRRSKRKLRRMGGKKRKDGTRQLIPKNATRYGR